MIKNRRQQRRKRHFRIRKRIMGTSICPRLVVFVSNKNFYAQIIDDQKMHTLCSFSSKNLPEKKGNNIEIAKLVGKNLAKIAKEKNIQKIVFDRNGFLFHGKIKAFATTMRHQGVKF